jgi:DNA-binding CsgD family transcriptional regulator
MRHFDQFVTGLQDAVSLAEIGTTMLEAVRETGADTFDYAARTGDGECIVFTDGTPVQGPDRPDRSPLLSLTERAAVEHLPFFWNAPGNVQHDGWRCWAVPIPDVPGRAGIVTFGAPEESGAFGKHKATLHAMAIHLHANIRKLTARRHAGQPNRLTYRELQCLHWASRGKSRTDTAQILGIRPRTVKFHLENVQRKFEVAHTSQAILQAAALGLLSTDQPHALRRPPHGNGAAPHSHRPAEIAGD